MRKRIPIVKEEERRDWFKVVHFADHEYTLALRRNVPGRIEDALLLIVNLHGLLNIDIPYSNVAETKPPNDHLWKLEIDTEAEKYGGRGDTQYIASRLSMSGPGAVLLVVSRKQPDEGTVERKEQQPPEINTGGGAYIGGNVYAQNFVGRDKSQQNNPNNQSTAAQSN